MLRAVCKVGRFWWVAAMAGAVAISAASSPAVAAAGPAGYSPRAWHATGAHRILAAPGDAQYQQADAVAIMDQLTPALIKALFSPLFAAGGIHCHNDHNPGPGGRTAAQLAAGGVAPPPLVRGQRAGEGISRATAAQQARNSEAIANVVVNPVSAGRPRKVVAATNVAAIWPPSAPRAGRAATSATPGSPPS